MCIFYLMSDKDTYIKIPPGSKVEIITDNDDKSDVEDLAISSSKSTYSAINSSHVNKASHYNSPTVSSDESSSTITHSAPSSSSQGVSSSKSISESSSSGEATVSGTYSELETSDDISNIELEDDKKKTLKVKIKNYFKFK